MGKQQGGKKSGSGKKKRSTGKQSRFGLHHALLGTAVFLTGVGLLVALSLPPRGTETPQSVSRDTAPEARKDIVSREDQGRRKAPASSGREDKKYEEPSSPFSRAVEQVDLALIQSLAAVGVEPNRLEQVGLEVREKGQREFRFQKVELRVSPDKGRRVLNELEGLLGQWLPDKATLKRAPGSRRAWRVHLDNAVTHRIALRSERGGVPDPGKSDSPRIALVMDDMGNSLRRARALLDLFGEDVALSVLPRSPYCEQIAGAARDLGADVLLHLPMEPKEYPETDPGPGALFVDMVDERIRSVVERDLDKVPGIVGVNNHMGSRFTTAKGPMREVFHVLRRRDLFFMDSLTSPDSVVKQLASSMGMQTISRDIFLDNKKNVESIRRQLRKAEKLAREWGHVVVSGHPYPQTIEALRQWLENKSEEVRLCRLSRLVHAENDSQAERRMADGTTDTGYH